MCAVFVFVIVFVFVFVFDQRVGDAGSHAHHPRLQHLLSFLGHLGMCAVFVFVIVYACLGLSRLILDRA